jgi:AcrR family transcriptional regulator
MTSPLKHRVLETADQLFYAEGIRAVGIDRIIAESGIAKASFYRFFESKDALIAEWIQMRDLAWTSWFEEAVDMLAPDPANRPIAVFDALYSRLRSPSFRGCAFLNTIVELARDSHPAVQAARAHKIRMQELIRGYLEAAGYASSSEEISAGFMQLVDGALISALREGQPAAGLRAKEMAQIILASHEKKLPSLKLKKKTA